MKENGELKMVGEEKKWRIKRRNCGGRDVMMGGEREKGDNEMKVVNERHIELFQVTFYI